MTDDTGASVPPTARALSGATAYVRRHRVLIARMVWLALVGLTLALFALSMPAYFARVQQTCVTATTCALDGALSPASMRAVQDMGFSPHGYAVYSIVFYGAVAAIWAFVGFLVFWRRSDQWIGLVGSFVLVTYNPGVRDGATYALSLADPSWDIPVKSMNSLVTGAIVLFFFLFPDGQLVPRWLHWPVVALAVLPALSIFSPADSPFNNDTGSLLLNSLTFLGTLAAITIAQIYRYRRVSRPLQRQQVKWALFGMSITVIGLFCLGLAPVFIPSLQSTSGPYNAFLNTIYPLVVLPVPIFIAVSILRSRLWDIDVIIRRTLIYGTLTTILAAAYVAVTIGAQIVGERLTGQAQPPPWLVVIITLLAAALASPLRLRVQRVIDRSFYRTGYNTARTVEAFASTLRTELDLNDLNARLIQVVEQTMRPAHISLWLRPLPPPQRHRTPM